MSMLGSVRPAPLHGRAWCATAVLLCVGLGGSPEEAGVVRATPPVEKETVTFTDRIAPLLHDRCAACHRPDGIAPFSVLTYAEVRPWARAIRNAVQMRSMPPWKPEPGYGGPFVGEQRLSEPEIELIAAWVDAGAPEGDRADRSPLPAAPGGWRLGEPDLVIEMPEAYTLQSEGTDVLRKFAIPIPVPGRRYVQGVEFQPGNPRVVHHANMKIDPTPASRELDAADPEPGYDGVTPFSARFPCGSFLGGTPGQGGERPGHRGQGGLQDVQLLDLTHAGGADADLGATQEPAIEGAASCRRERLRVVEPGGQRPGIEDHRRRDHRPGPRPPPGLVDPGDRPAEGRFEREVRHPPVPSF